MLHSVAEKLIEVNVHDGVIDSLGQVNRDVIELRASYFGASLSVVEAGFGEAGTAFEVLATN